MTDVAKTDGFAARAFIRRIGAFAPVIFLLALMIVFTILEPRFVSSINLFNVMRHISITGLVFLAFAILAHIILTYTRFGRHVYAVGGNVEAARLSGLPVRRILVAVYVIVGFFSGLAGFMLSARLNSSEAVAGIGYELTVIASVVIGGTSLFGGVGTIFGTVIGSILIGVLINGLVLMDVNPYVQQITIGLILVAVVAFDQFA